MKNLIELIENTNKFAKPYCLATVIKNVGSTPQQAGARMTIFADGSTLGTIGGGCVEGSIIKKAIEFIITKNEYYAELIEVNLTDPVGLADGDVCVGTMIVLLERI